MAVHSQRAQRHLGAHGTQHRPHAAWSSHPDGVTQRHLIAAHAVQALGYLQGALTVTHWQSGVSLSPFILYQIFLYIPLHFMALVPTNKAREAYI